MFFACFTTDKNPIRFIRHVVSISKYIADFIDMCKKSLFGLMGFVILTKGISVTFVLHFIRYGAYRPSFIVVKSYHLIKFMLMYMKGLGIFCLLIYFVILK